MLVRSKAEMLDGLSGVLRPSEEEGVGAGRGPHRELVEGQALASGGDDAGAGGCSESQRGDGELGDLEQSVVVRHGADYDNGFAQGLLACPATLGVRNDAGERDWRAIDLGHEETAEDDFVEV